MSKKEFLKKSENVKSHCCQIDIYIFCIDSILIFKNLKGDTC